MIENAYIENFKGINKLEIKDFKNVNLLVGFNNSCKTTLLQALALPYLANSPKQICEILDIPTPPKILPKENNFIPSLFYKLNPDNFYFKINLSNISLLVKYENITMSKDNLRFEYSLINTDIRANVHFIFENVIDTKSFQDILEMQIKKDSIIIDSSFSFPNVLYLSADTDFKTLAIEHYQELFKQKNTATVIEYLKKIEPNLTEMAFWGDLYCDIGYDRRFPIDIMGDGFFKFFAITAIMQKYENGIIFIDEIENGFHYKSLETLWDFILETAKKFNIQVFATTHSYDCALAMSEAYKQLSDKSIDIRLFRLEKNEDKIRKMKYTAEDLDAVIKDGWEVR